MMTFTDFDEAHDSLPEGHTICGTFVDKQAVYFHASIEATEAHVRDMAFEVREGRTPSQYEQQILSLAENMKAAG